MAKKKFKWIIFSAILLVALIFAFARFFNKNAGEENILEVNLREHKNLALHIHPFLEIEILGQQYTIPANTGISAKGMRVIHTHDSTGKLHVESPYPHQFYLKDFFSVWKKSINSSCIFDYCEDDAHVLEFYVNGVKSEERENLSLKDGDAIKIVYKKK